MGDWEFIEHCDVDMSEPKYLLTLSQHAVCSNATYFERADMIQYELHADDTVRHVQHIFWTILPVLFCFANARIATHFWSYKGTLRFLLEFVIIAIPTVLSVNVANDHVEFFAAVMCCYLLLLFWCKRSLMQDSKLQECHYALGGKRPRMLTLVRATINYLTALCILAIDFESFPKEFRKSRRFGAGLMDVGIGLFVFSMGSVSQRLRKVSDLTRLLRVVAPILLLGLARTIVIVAIDYHQDEHEYGVHMNAFFTLGLTKLFGTLISAITRKDWQLLPLGMAMLLLHEYALQAGISDYVMENDLERDTFLNANREGLCSLPGFIGIYLISMFVGQWLQTNESISFQDLLHKIKSLTLVSVFLWLLLYMSIYQVGIARVTCNFGYAIWILGIALTMALLFLCVFDLILNTLWPVDETGNANAADANGLLGQTKLSDDNSLSAKLHLPLLVEAINRNGLTFFLLANVLTGGVNIYLKPEERGDATSIVILTLYMLIVSGFVYILYRFRIRIA